MLKVWNMVLVALAFELSIFGTFLTRSGVVNSIHSFAKSSIGAWFLAFVVISSLFSRRADHVAPAAAEGADEARVGALARGDVPLQQPAARRAVPDDPLGRPLPDRDASWCKGETRTIGRPYYDFFLRTFGLPLLLLMGIGPLIAWRQTSRPRALARRSPGRRSRRSSPARSLLGARRRLSSPG